MSEADRLAMEEEVVSAITHLGWRGDYHSLTHGQPDSIGLEKQKQLIDNHLLWLVST